MSTPVLHLLAGPNGAGKSTFVMEVLQPVTHLPFVNAEPSFITETVFSHPSKVELVGHAVAVGYVVQLHVILVPETVLVARVAGRVAQGGHDVPEHKIRERYARLWSLVAAARDLADRTTFYDNSRASTPFRVVATYERGRLVGNAAWPVWTPLSLRAARSVGPMRPDTERDPRKGL